MIVASHAFSSTGGHGDLNDLAMDTFQIPGTVVEAGADNVREAVRRELKGGSDWVKIMGSGGVMSQNDDPEVPGFSQEELDAFADETHRHRKKITAHVHGNIAGAMVAKAGFDSIEHGTLFKEDTIDLMVENGVALIPTTYVVDWIIEQGEGGGITEDNLMKALLVKERHATAVKLAYDKGVAIGFGTDQIFEHALSPNEFLSLAKAGIPPHDVLAAATSVAAKILEMEEEIGTIDVGKRADIIAVSGNPLEDLSVMHNVTFVRTASS